jgi:predicted nucleic acid-binding protein
MIFWDTSALLKCYNGAETDHQRAINLLLREKGHQGCALLRLETISGLARRSSSDRALRDSLIARVEDQLKAFDLVPLDEAILDVGVRLAIKHSLRAADSLHLAAAIQTTRQIGRRTLHFATADAEQASAAAAERLKVLRLAL